jgi:hypothetical protein
MDFIYAQIDILKAMKMPRKYKEHPPTVRKLSHTFLTRSRGIPEIVTFYGTYDTCIKELKEYLDPLGLRVGNLVVTVISKNLRYVHINMNWELDKSYFDRTVNPITIVL